MYISALFLQSLAEFNELLSQCRLRHVETSKGEGIAGQKKWERQRESGKDFTRTTEAMSGRGGGGGVE